MKKIKALIILLLVFYYTNSFAQKEIILKNMIEEVTFLASDQLQGRETGTKYEEISAKYIRAKYKKYNLLPGNGESYFQIFKATIKSNPHSNIKNKKVQGINVIGYMDNSKAETIIIGAHYDHLGYGEFGSRYDGDREIHNGADDNASGVSVLLNLANNLSLNSNYNYLFIAFSGEEHGLLGSSYFAKNPTVDLKKVKFMLNFDMVGRLNDERTLAVNGVGTSDAWGKLLNKANTMNFVLKTSESGFGASDHTAFYLQEIPVLHFFTGQHEDYHKPSDDVDKINFNGMYLIMEYVKSIIEHSEKIKTFKFQETVTTEKSTPKFKVTLGIMPDYLYDGKGLKIDGVTKNKTANKFGILKGDIIVKLGDLEITDIYKYMEGLSLHKTGDSTIVRVKRGEKILDVPIVF